MSSPPPRPPDPDPQPEPQPEPERTRRHYGRWGATAALLVVAGIVAIALVGPLAKNDKESARAGGVCSNLLVLAHNLDRRFGLVITSTTGGGHATHSLHYRGMAVDISGSSGNMYRAAAYVSSTGLYRGLLEGIHNPNLSVAKGSRVSPGYWGSVTWANHRNHLHLGGCSPILARSGRTAKNYKDRLPLSVRRRSHGRRVRVVQRRLNRIRGKGTRAVHVDGKYGRGTARRVRQFQHHNAKPADGVVGRRTYRAIGRVDRQVRRAHR